MNENLAAHQKGVFVLSPASELPSGVFPDSLSCHLVFEVLASEQTVHISLKAQAVLLSILVRPSAPHVSSPRSILSPLIKRHI